MTERKNPTIPGQPDETPKPEEKPLLPDLTQLTKHFRDFDFRDRLGFGHEEYDPVKDLPNGRVKALISALAPEEKTSAAYSFKKFEEWSQKPKQARVEWLLSLYQKRSWISGEEFVELKTMSPDEAYEKLRKRCLERANLRPEQEHQPKQIYLTLSDIPEDAKLMDILHEHGIEGINLKIRALENAQRLNLAMSSGNDRDWGSQQNRNYHGGYDGEELAMIRAGVHADQSTYVTDLRDNIGAGYLRHDKNILVYSGDALEGIGPNGYPRSNGFSIFHFREDNVMRRSLLAVIQCH